MNGLGIVSVLFTLTSALVAACRGKFKVYGKSKGIECAAVLPVDVLSDIL